MSFARSDAFPIREAARFGRTSIWSIYRRIRDGEMRTFRAGGGRNLMIPRDDLVAFLLNHGIPLPPELAQPRVRILVVDDSDELCSVIERFLGRLGDFEVRTASTGFKAGFALPAFKPDVVLLDIRLPDIDGRELFLQLAETEGFEHVRVVAMTGYVEKVDESELFAMGFDAFLPKPFDMPQLAGLLRGLLADKGEAEDATPVVPSARAPGATTGRASRRVATGRRR